MSSWEWPLDRNEAVQDPKRFMATCWAAHKRIQLFFSSLEQLSPCNWRWVARRSNPSWEIKDNPWLMISVERLLLQVTKCGDNTVRATCPWISSEVEPSLGRAHEANSLEDMHLALGHECLSTPMESRIAVIVEGQDDEDAKRLKERLSQYSRLWLYCLCKCFWSCAICALRAGKQWPSLRMINRWRKHWLQRAWWFDFLIRSKCLKSFIHTSITQLPHNLEKEGIAE